MTKNSRALDFSPGKLVVSNGRFQLMIWPTSAVTKYHRVHVGDIGLIIGNKRYKNGSHVDHLVLFGETVVIVASFCLMRYEEEL